jgi:MFS transporter, UMF1 family
MAVHAHVDHTPPVLTPDGGVVAVTRAPARERWSWAIYDFANTIWSMNVASLYFSTWLVVDLGASSSATMWATSISSVLMAICVPLLGAVSDARRKRKAWVVGFTIASCVATAAIGFIAMSAVPKYGEGVIGGSVRPESYHFGGMTLFWIALAFTVANFAYQAAQPFYNAMMTELVPPKEYGTLSGLGTGIGYGGTIFGIMMVAPFFNGQLPLVGELSEGVTSSLRAIFPATANAGRASTFVPTAILFLLFTLPLILFNRDHRPAPKGAPIQWGKAFAELGRTFKEAKQHPGVLRFILTSLVYQDAVGTVTAVLGLYAIKAVGMSQNEVNTVFAILPVTAIIGSILTGKIVDRLGAKRTLTGVLIAWSLLVAALIFFPGKLAFWVVGALIGLVAFGGVPTSERPLLLSLVPEKDAGRYFSLMLLSSRAASFIGPLVWGYTIDALEPSAGTLVAYHVALGTVGVFFVAAVVLLRGVPEGRKAA